jgi:hypothetical protein
MKYTELTKLKTISAILALSAAISFAQEPVAPVAAETPLDPEISKIQAKYEAEYKKIEEQGKQIEKDAPKGAENTAGVDIDFSKWHDVSFDVPEFRMKLHRIVLDLPSVTMRTKRIVWDNPEVTMENRVVGKYPEFHGLKVKWSDIITKVPVTRMVRKEAKLDVPEFSMKRQEMKFDLPEIFRTRRVSMKIPEIKVRTTENAKDETEEGTREIEKTTAALAAAQQAEIKEFSIKKLTAERSNLETQLKEAVAQINDAITKSRAAGADPAKLVSEDGTVTDLNAVLQNVNAEFAKGIQAIDDAIAQLQK